MVQELCHEEEKMENTKVSRRKFVGTAALGAGGLAFFPSARLFGSETSAMSSVLKNVWKLSKEYTMDFAQEMPDDKYGFKPTEEVYSYSEQLLHLAGGNFWFFSSIKGEKSPKPEDAFGAEGKSKSDVMKLLKESFSYGDEVIEALNDDTAKEEVAAGQTKLPKWKIVLFCTDHLTHHRGQMVVYLRLNGIKPPQYRSGYYA